MSWLNRYIYFTKSISIILIMSSTNPNLLFLSEYGLITWISFLLIRLVLIETYFILYRCSRYIKNLYTFLQFFAIYGPNLLFFQNAIINGVTGAIEGGIEAETSIIDSIVDSLVGKKRWNNFWEEKKTSSKTKGFF